MRARRFRSPSPRPRRRTPASSTDLYGEFERLSETVELRAATESNYLQLDNRFPATMSVATSKTTRSTTLSSSALQRFGERDSRQIPPTALPRNGKEPIMENQGLQRDSAGWRFYTRTSFVCSVIATYWGIYFLPVDPWIRGYMAMGVLFVIGTTFTLAKAIRDDHESTKLINQISQAKTEKILKEYDVTA